MIGRGTALCLAAGVVGLGVAAAPAAGAAPPGCDAARPAVAHHAGARPAPAPATPLVPCLYRTGLNGYEPTLGVTTAGAVFVDAVAGADNHPEVVRSTDQGATWTVVSPKLVGDVNAHPATADPYLYVDKATSRVFSDDFLPGCSPLSYSDDNGASWAHTVVGCTHADHQSLFAGPPPAGGRRPSGYPNVVYYCAISGGVSIAAVASACSRSLDGGRVFLPSGDPAFVDDPSQPEGDFGIPGACDGSHGHGSVGPDGTVYLPRGWCGKPWLAMSRDEGRTWRRVQVSTLGMAATSLAIFEHEAGAVADAHGDVFYVWLARDRLPYLAVSRDGGSHWGAPMMVAPPGVREASLPGIDIGPGGRIALVYIGSTDSPGPPFPERTDCKPDPVACVQAEVAPDPSEQARYSNTTWNGYVTVTDDPLAADPTFQTATVNDPADPLARGECGPTPIRCEEGDFVDVVVGSDRAPWAAFVDICVDACARPPSDGDKVANAQLGVVARVVPG